MLAMLIQEIILWMAIALGKERIKQGRQLKLCVHVVELALKEIQHHIMIHLRSTATLKRRGDGFSLPKISICVRVALNAHHLHAAK
jgi:hypothetical protein